MKQHAIVLIDISYSMKKNSNSIIKGLNMFVERLQKGNNSDNIYLTVVLFCDEMHYLSKAIPIKDVSCFSKKQLTYYEIAYQCKYDVLETNSYNDNIMSRIFRKDLHLPD